MVGFIAHTIPDSVVPVRQGDVLQSSWRVLFGVALNAVGHIGGPVMDLISRAPGSSSSLNFVKKLAPLGAFRSVAYRSRYRCPR